MLLKLNAYPTFNVLNVYLGVAPLRDALPAEEVSAGRGGGVPPGLQAQDALGRRAGRRSSHPLGTAA